MSDGRDITHNAAHGKVEAPIQLLEGIMARDFMLGCQDPELLRARVPEIPEYECISGTPLFT
jgi:hypothetical protein